MASPSKNKNKNDTNQESQVKHNKLISSEYCEKNCKDVRECQKYKDYVVRMVVLHKVGKGLLCDK